MKHTDFVGVTIKRHALAWGLLALWPFLPAFEPLRSRNHSAEEGNAKLKGGKPDEALAAYDKALPKLGGDPALRFDRGSALFALSRFDEAADEFLRATEAKDPPLKEAAFYNLGNALFHKDKFKEAADAYQRALGIDPRDQKAKWNLEIALKKEHDEDQKKKQNDDKNKDQDKKNKQDQKDKKDQSKNDKSKDQDKKQDQKKDQNADKNKDRPPEQKNQNDSPKPEDEHPASEQQQMEAVLDSLDKSPKNLEQERARLRAVRRAPPAKDW